MPQKAPSLDWPPMTVWPQTYCPLLAVSPGGVRGAKMHGYSLEVRREDGAALATGGHPTTNYLRRGEVGYLLYECGAMDGSAPRGPVR